MTETGKDAGREAVVHGDAVHGDAGREAAVHGDSVHGDAVREGAAEDAPGSAAADSAKEGGVRAGDVLVPLKIPVTRTLVVAGAVASRDYQDVHHDAEAARAKGSPDVFMNILTTNGLVGRYVTDHFGPGAVLRKVAIRLGAPNYPGDTMTLTGEVAEAADGPDGTVVALVRIAGANGLGHHVTGTVTVEVPR